MNVICIYCNTYEYMYTCTLSRSIEILISRFRSGLFRIGLLGSSASGWPLRAWRWTPGWPSLPEFQRFRVTKGTVKCLENFTNVLRNVLETSWKNLIATCVEKCWKVLPKIGINWANSCKSCLSCVVSSCFFRLQDSFPVPPASLLQQTDACSRGISIEAQHVNRLWRLNLLMIGWIFIGQPGEIHFSQDFFHVGELLLIRQRFANVANQLLLQADLLIQRPRDSVAVGHRPEKRVREQRTEPLGSSSAKILLPLALLAADTWCWEDGNKGSNKIIQNHVLKPSSAAAESSPSPVRMDRIHPKYASSFQIPKSQQLHP